MRLKEWKRNCNNKKITKRGGVLGLILFLPLSISAQDIVAPPMDIPLLLSGNCGELRNNHFHSGIDIKTQGRTGIPVKTVADGYVSRISVSPYGYGNALYITHPDGKTSVYGHLDRFIPAIESIVRDKQYQEESVEVNIMLPAGKFPVKQGAQVAWSGNTGGSGGPHLHFELRDTKTGRILDPLLYLKGKIRDTRSPDIRGVMVFPQFNRGVANGSAQNQPITIVQAKKTGKQSLAKSITAWGQIGIGIKAYDRMNETTNSYGVKEITLKVDGKEVYHSVMDRFLIEDTRYINTYIDWKEWTENRSFYMKSFTDPGNYLGIDQAQGNGIFSIDKEKTYLLEYTLKDAYGNTSSFRFEITGKKTPIPHTKPIDVYFPFNKDNTYTGKGIDLQIPKGNLYTDLYLKTGATIDYTPFAPLYKVGDPTPLHSYCPLTLTVANDTYSDPSKYGVISVWKGKKNWVRGKYKNGKITAQIRELGQFSIEVDTVPPVITPVNAAKWDANQRISFKITDDLSGIKSYKGTLNGKFILFEYDYKTNSLYYKYDPKRMGQGEQALKLIITDGAGNETVFYLPRI
jgi:hypothetical protein